MGIFLVDIIDPMEINTKSKHYCIGGACGAILGAIGAALYCLSPTVSHDINGAPSNNVAGATVKVLLPRSTTQWYSSVEAQSSMEVNETIHTLNVGREQPLFK